MKYTYAYRDSSGTRHTGSIEAASRDAAFAALRKDGIRPIKVVAADGSKENGAPVGIGKRSVVLLSALGVLAVAAAVAYVMLFLDAQERVPPAFIAAETRRQIIGDAAIVEKGILTGWADVFPEEGERFLASFAVPGVKAGQRNTTAGEIEAALGRNVPASENDGIEARQIKAMVEGMKAEARAYIAAGGSIVEYGKRLTERQEAEIAVYERAKAEMERAKETMSGQMLIAYWEEQNDKLRNLGIRPVTLESLE